MTEGVAMHLADADHPYYATEGCWHCTDQAVQFDSFAEFLEEMGDLDPDMNLIYRWDWQRYEDSGDVLEIFYVLQRKAHLMSVSIAVTPEDEPAVLKFLTPKARHIALLWEPIWQTGAS